jgi:seryl-tRNA synthetase
VAAAQKDLAEMFDTQLGRERGGRKELHGNITEIKAELAALRAETKNLTSSLDEVKEDSRDTRARIDLIPQRMVDMLRATKNLI